MYMYIVCSKRACDVWRGRVCDVWRGGCVMCAERRSMVCRGEGV